MKKQLLVLLTLFLVSACSQKQRPYHSTDEPKDHTEGKIELKSSMIGYSTMTEVMLWAQATKNTDLTVSYSLENEESKTSYFYPDNEALSIYKMRLKDLEPGKTYTYKISTYYGEELAKGRFQTQPIWQWRTDPPAFDFAFGSCAYINEAKTDRPGKPYGGDFEIFTTIKEKQPDFMLWGGDNIYLREADWNSESGIIHRYEHTRTLPELQELLQSTHNYAIWDDHDFGPNDSDRSYFLKDKTLQAFQDFWANPSYGINGKPGITSKFQWNDCEFFLMDNRYYRTPQRKTIDQFILGEEQVQWLIDNLSTSKASFKFVVIGGQLLNPAKVWENHAKYGTERERIIKLIQEEKIKNVVFLTGDRHHSEISMLQEKGKPTIYDITSSPLTSGSHNARDEGNFLQVEDSMLHQRNFAWIKVDGKWGERILHLQYLDKQGNKLFDYEIKQEK